jgi:hypothetical protein
MKRFGNMMGGATHCADPDSAMKMWENHNHTGILLTLDDRPGSLNDALAVFKHNNINMTSIQSRPPKHFANKREMSFHIDFVGTLDQENVKKALA